MRTRPKSISELIGCADQINKETLEISAPDDEVYSDMDALAEDLPMHSPRFVLLSYPLTLVSDVCCDRLL